MALLDDGALAQGLAKLEGWERHGDTIAKTYRRQDFRAAIAYVNEIAEAAETANHHPDIDIRWNAVTLALSTHSAGGITDKDLSLAAQADELAHSTPGAE
jgi:4a-hydroxytetrahydrobiopterin dehydratase